MPNNTTFDPNIAKLIGRVEALADCVTELTKVVTIFGLFHDPNRPDSDIIAAGIGISKGLGLVPTTLTNGDLKKASQALDFVSKRLKTAATK